MNITDILDKKECCGCTGCYQKCPQKAITMQEDEEGFKYPIVDKSKCIDCRICAKVCPQKKEAEILTNPYPKAYAMYNKNASEVNDSSSGGVFSVLANYVLANNGIVFGAAYSENLKVQHIKVENKSELSRLRNSKYVQSDINQMYIEAEKALNEQRLVLFSGTPCQINGLNSYLNKKYQNLITVDFVCHGVPSQRLFDTYISYLSKKYKSNVIEYNFRNKEKKGWALLSKIVTEDGKARFIEPDFDPYYYYFLKCTTYRENCYNCHYANFNRVSDITIADYFAAKRIHPDFFNKNGVSLFLTNNEKAEKILNKISDNVKYIETDLNFAANNNKNLLEPSKRPQIRDTIYNGINNLSAKEFIDKNLKIKITTKRIIKKMIPLKIKKILKNIKK